MNISIIFFQNILFIKIIKTDVSENFNLEPIPKFDRIIALLILIKVCLVAVVITRARTNLPSQIFQMNYGI